MYLPILTGKQRARKGGWQQNPMGFLSQPRKRQVNRQRPSQDGRTRGLGIAGSPSRETDNAVRPGGTGSRYTSHMAFCMTVPE